jgi:hypothetical protein
MKFKKKIKAVSALAAVVLLFSFISNRLNTDDIPKLWDDKKVKSVHLPMADKTVELKPISEELYYKLKEKVAYKTYPLYAQGREPKGYFEWLLKQEPEIVFDASKLKTEEDWIKAGELMYELPESYSIILDSSMDMKRFKELYEEITATHIPYTKDGIVPYFSLTVRKKGRIEMGSFSCGNCHNKVMPDGSVLKGGQGNFPFDDGFGWGLKKTINDEKMNDSAATAMLSESFIGLFGASWVKSPSQEYLSKPEPKHSIGVLMSTVPGVMHRHGSVLGSPTAIPDLFNIKERKYLDRTGLQLNRDIGDLMRYAALNQDVDFFNEYGGAKIFPWSDSIVIANIERFSDAQAYALSKYLYTLKPLPNPVKAAPELIARGKVLFEEESCIGCHTPPFYSSNMLAPVPGFTPTKEDKAKYDILDIGVMTDPGLALYSRRGTGYYKVPSLAGVWNRNALMHSGYVTSLEEMFNPDRQNDDFIPSGFNPNIDKPFAVKGHSFGLGLNAEDKKALIAFLRTL